MCTGSPGCLRCVESARSEARGVARRHVPRCPWCPCFFQFDGGEMGENSLGEFVFSFFIFLRFFVVFWGFISFQNG